MVQQIHNAKSKNSILRAQLSTSTPIIFPPLQDLTPSIQHTPINSNSATTINSTLNTEVNSITKPKQPIKIKRSSLYSLPPDPLQ